MHEQRDGPKVVKSRQDEPIPGPREDFATVWHRPDATCDNTTSFSSRNLLSYPLPFNTSCVLCVHCEWSQPDIFSSILLQISLCQFPIDNSSMILRGKESFERKRESAGVRFKFRFATTRGIYSSYIQPRTLVEMRIHESRSRPARCFSSLFHDNR